MRLALEILSATVTEVIFAALPVSDDMLLDDRVVFSWERTRKTAKFGGVSSVGLFSFTGGILTDIQETLEESEIDIREATPLQVFRALLVDGARQVVYDEKLKKYRNVETMVAGENTWKAVGTPITVMCDKDSDEDIAKRRLQKAISDRMAENPKEAPSLAGWYAGGMKVEKIVTGQVEVIDWKTLALDGEKAEPVVKKIRKRKNAAQ